MVVSSRKMSLSAR